MLNASAIRVMNDQRATSLPKFTALGKEQKTAEVRAGAPGGQGSKTMKKGVKCGQLPRPWAISSSGLGLRCDSATLGLLPTAAWLLRFRTPRKGVSGVAACVDSALWSPVAPALSTLGPKERLFK